MVLGTWFGAGLLPIMPGSWASLAALPCGWAIRHFWGVVGLAMAVGFTLIAGWWAAEKIARASATKDPGAVVIDEVAAQWLVLLPAPADLRAYALAFLLFRVFDIWKPWPIRWADRQVKGGVGVMLDDILAAVYAGLVLSVLLAIGGAFGVRS